MGTKICSEPWDKVCLQHLSEKDYFFLINSGYSKRLEREKPMSTLSFWTKTPQVRRLQGHLVFPCQRLWPVLTICGSCITLVLLVFSLFYGVLSRICRQKAPLSGVSSRQPIRLWGQPWISRLHVYIYHKNQWNVKQRPLFPPIESRIKAVRLFEFTCEEKNSVPRWWTGTACSCHSIADLLHTRICEKEPHVQMADRGLFFSFFFFFLWDELQKML